jgi:hypothetical protein
LDQGQNGRHDALHLVALCCGIVGIWLMTQLAWDVFRLSGGKWHALSILLSSGLYFLSRIKNSILIAGTFFTLSVSFLLINFPHFAAIRIFDASPLTQAQFYASRYTMYAFLRASSLAYTALGAAVTCSTFSSWIKPRT